MKRLKRLWIALFGCCWIAGAANAGPLVEFIPQANGEVKWSEGVLRAMGTGIAPKDADSPAQARLLARAAAIADAYRNLAQVISAVRVSANTNLERYAAAGDTVRLNVEACIRGAEVADERDNPDGTHTVLLQVGLYGRDALTGILPPGVLRGQLPPARVDTATAAPAAVLPGIETIVQPAPTPGGACALDRSLEPELVTAGTDEGPFTGVIIDARGLGVQPAMSPRLYDPSGKELYSAANVDPSFAEDVGVAGYMGTIKAALTLPRVGERPLVIRASATPDAFHRYLTLSASDAERLQAANEKAHFLEKCAVAIIIDERRVRDEGKVTRD